MSIIKQFAHLKRKYADLKGKYADLKRKYAPRPVHGIWREVLAEFAGTCMLIYFGCGSVAQAVLREITRAWAEIEPHIKVNLATKVPHIRAIETSVLTFDILSINLGFALGTMMAMFLSRETSGAHLNPAITLPMAIMRRIPMWKVPWYMCAQLLGAFFGAAGVYTVYSDAIMEVVGHDPKNHMTTAAIFATYSNKHLGTLNGFVEQMCATGALVMLVLAITDRKNMGIPKDFDDKAQPAYMISKRFLEALSISLLILVIGVSQHHNSGYAINPARDLGPRLFTLCAGWGSAVFTDPDGKNWFWIPVLGPMVGGLLGAAMYHLFIGLHLSEPKQGDREPSVVEDISDDQAQPGEAAADSSQKP